MAFAPPIGMNIPGCNDSAEQSGTATGAVTGFATQRAFAFELVPQLTLLGFSRLGCPVDALVGGGLVYAKPISKTISLSFSGGVIYRPRVFRGSASHRSRAASTQGPTRAPTS